MNDCPQCQTNDREQRAARKVLKAAGVDKTLVELLPLADGIRRIVRVIPFWTQTPPCEQGTYWHWSGDEDDAPLPTFVLGGGHSTDGKCFVSAGQLGLTHAIDCADYGGWWSVLQSPRLPCVECGDQGGRHQDFVVPGPMEHGTIWVDCWKCRSVTDPKRHN